MKPQIGLGGSLKSKEEILPFTIRKVSPDGLRFWFTIDYPQSDGERNLFVVDLESETSDWSEAVFNNKKNKWIWSEDTSFNVKLGVREYLCLVSDEDYL